MISKTQSINIIHFFLLSPKNFENKTWFCFTFPLRNAYIIYIQVNILDYYSASI